MDMKVNFVVTHLSHDSPGSFYRPYEMVKQLNNFGIDTTILTPFEEDVKIFRDIHMKKIPILGNNLKITNFGYGLFRKIVYNKRTQKFVPYDIFLDKLSSQLEKGLYKVLEDKPDILQAEQEVAALACIRIGKKMQIPTIIDIHNVWAEELAAMNILKPTSKIFQNLMKNFEFIINNANRIIAVNDFMKDYLISKFALDSKKIIIIPPGGKNFSQSYPSDAIQPRLKTKKIIYAGLVNPREHVDLFVKSIPFIAKKHPEAEFIISNKGENIDKIKKLCKKLSINPNFYWFQSLEKARELINTCYVGVLPSSNDTGRKLGTPLKLMEYLSNGLPVIANNIGSWCNIIEENKLGILTEDSPDNFAEGINRLIEDKKLYNSLCQNIWTFLKKFNWKTHIEQYLIPAYEKLIT